jgi:DNA-binding cell septation regulator SpoVG
MADQNEPNKTSSILVTEVHLQLTRRPPVLAYVSVTLWGCVAIHDLRLLERHDETRVLLMPRQQSSDGTWSTIAHPVREEVRAEIERKVLLAYERAIAGRKVRTAPVATEAIPVNDLPRREVPSVIPARAAEA